jgi:hypothetical protein
MAATPATSLTLVSSGLADARQRPSLGNPDVNQFVKVLKKTTRWAAQLNRVEFDGAPEFGKRVSMTLPRIGELVNGFTLAVTMPDIYAPQLAAIKAAGGTSFDASGAFLGPVYGWTNSLGHALIQQIELEIGGTIVQTLDGRLLEILDELNESLEAVIAKNAMIKRKPNGFNARSWLTPTPLTVYIPIPFWFSRRGITSHALPLEALAAEIVRVHVTFRPIAELFYTEARVNTATVGYREGTDPAAATPPAMWPLAGGRFWMADATATGRVYDMNAEMPAGGVSGKLIDGITMPTRFSPDAAFALVEYISLEEYEALAFRSAELTYPVEQHVAVPVTATQTAKEVRIELPYSNPTKEILWVAQRPEVATYNAWFLFTRDLGPVVPPQASAAEKSPCALPWWPDAVLLPTAGQRWEMVPAFRTAFSEPLQGAALLYNSYDRFVHEGGSFFRGVVPSQSFTKSAIHNRYVYAYAFGQRRRFAAPYGPRGAANWDKIPRKEAFFTMAAGRGGVPPPAMNLYVYVTIWNIFKVYGGRGGLLFTN